MSTGQMNKRIWWLAAAAIGTAVLAYLAFGVFGVHTAFIDETVNEENPFAVAAPAAQDTDSTEASADSTTVPEAAPETTTDAPDDAPDNNTADPVSDTAPEAEQPAEPAAEETAPEQPAPTAVPEVPQIVTLASGTLVDHDHTGEGTANVITDGQRTFLRFEDDFAIDNGPDLDVYLVRGADAEGDPGLFDDDFINLGDLKGNIGAQNYELPEGVDITEYNTVAIWCVRFGVAFNAVNLT